METSVEGRLAGAAEACRLRLADPAFSEVLNRLGPLGQPGPAFHLLSQITAEQSSGGHVRQLCASIPTVPGQNLAERVLLTLASQHAIPQVPGLAVADSVKRLLADEFLSFANPPSAWERCFQIDDVRYREMVRVASLRRFPVGQFQWEVSGFPRSWVARARQPWRVLFDIGRMGGFAPFFELHLNDRRKNRLILLEKEAQFSYCRVARSIEKQPAVRGLMMSSWLFCASTARVTPRLAWLREIPQSAGASLVDLGSATPESGFLIGSEERRKMYEEGTYRPKIACVLWPRKSLIEWANAHPEFEDK